MSDTDIPTSGSNYPTVVEMVEGYQFNVTFEVSTATRVFTSATPVGATTLTLPAIGSKFNDDWPFLTLKSISQSYMGNRPTCPKKYTCSYDTRPYPTMELLVTPEPTLGIEIGADCLTYTNPVTDLGTNETLWRWNVGGTKTDAPDLVIPKMEYRTTLTMTRYLYKDDLRDWYEVSHPRLGTINKTAFKTFAIGLVQYAGAQITRVTSENNKAAWRAELKFNVRYVYNPNATTNAAVALDWNYVFDVKDATYKKLCLNGDTATPLYESTEFADLLTTCAPSYTATNPDLPHVLLE